MGDHRRARAIVAEFAIVSSVFLLYRSGRLFTRNARGHALTNAGHVIDFERALGIFSERAVQGWALSSDATVDFLNHYYVAVHFPLTIAFLVWAYLRHHRAYRFIRTWFVIVTLTALVIHVGFPLAPPRMTSGFEDTLQRFGPRIYSRDPRRSVANQFAAMPSLHFGWSLMLAVAFIAIKRSRRSALIIIHPVLTLFAIVATGNHYWLDAIIAGLLTAIVGVAMVLWRVRHDLPADPPTTFAPVAHARLAADEAVSVYDFALDDGMRLLGPRSKERCRQHTPDRHERPEPEKVSCSGAPVDASASGSRVDEPG